MAGPGGKATTKGRIVGAGTGSTSLEHPLLPELHPLRSCLPQLLLRWGKEPSRISSRDQEEMWASALGERGCENPAGAGVAWSSSLKQQGKAGGKGKALGLSCVQGGTS